MTHQKIFNVAAAVKLSFTALQPTSVFPQARVIPAKAQGFISSPRIAALRALARSAVLLRDHTSS